MISTYDIKQQLKTVFTVGNQPHPKEVILIIGSCRSVPYLNYLDRYNRSAGNPFRIHFIDPHNYHWDGGSTERKVDVEAHINEQESNPRLLKILKATTILIHEYYVNFGMFNTAKDAPKNIFQFGINPRMEICIPNFHDVAILGVTKNEGMKSIEKFCAVCKNTSFPEMADHFMENWQTRRFFWQANHVSKHFTMFIFKMMNDRFLRLDLSPEFWRQAESEDIYASDPAPVTQEDRENYQLKW